MWVIIKKTYAGPFGMFFIGQKYDIPEATVEQLRMSLGKENVIDTCAPWDEHKDHKAIEAAELIQKAKSAIAKIETMKAEMVELRKVAARINVLKKEFDDAVPKTEQLAKKAGIHWSAKAGART